MFAKALATASLALPLASAAIIDVFVGGENSLTFKPNSVTANVGDSVRFTFGVKNHTVTQSTFADPCTQITDASGQPSGFFSGYMPVAAGQTDNLPQFWIPVKDTKPIWAFCSQTGHCQKGMVFAINAPPAPADNSFENYQAKAMGLSTSSGSVSVSASTSSTADATAATTDSGDSIYGGSTDATTTDAAASSTPTTQTTTAATATASTEPLAGAASGSGTTHVVTVGGSSGNVFTPEKLTAAAGDTVVFQFQVKNHTVTQSTFAAPCTPMSGGVDSGFMPVASTATEFPTFNFTVKDTSPVWMFCKQTGHCVNSGMVFALNSDESSGSTKSFAAFQAAAKASGSSSNTTSTGSTTASSAVNGVIANSRAAVVTVGLLSVGLGLLL